MFDPRVESWLQVMHYICPMPQSLQTRSAVVTGAARGIGRAIAVELVAHGYRVVVTDIDAAAAERTAAEIGAAAGLGHDVVDEQSHHDIAAQACTYAPLGIWINNAGVGFDGRLADQDSSRVRALVDVNLMGTIWGSRAAIDVFAKQRADGIEGGEIGILASMSALGPVPGLSVYAATKAAVLSLATSLAVELRKDKVRVHAFCPDGVRTPMLDEMVPDGQARSLIASGTMYEASEVARAFVAMFGTGRVYRVMPRWRGAMMRTSAIAPRTQFIFEPAIRALGRRRLRKES